MASIATQILNKIRRQGRGWVFTPKDFLKFGTRSNVDFILHQLVKKNTIRRLGRGIYDYPKIHKSLGILTPDSDSLARAVAAQTGDKIQPSGARAANLLGLSTQVPAKPIYLTNGASRKKTVGNKVIVLKHSSLSLTNSTRVNLTLSALKYLGKTSIDQTVIQRCAKKLSKQQKQDLLKVSGKMPDWLNKTIQEINKKYG